MSELHQLYRHFDSEGTLLYVGVSLSVLTRLVQHKSSSSWYASVTQITIENYESREDAELAEKHAIESERPIWNVVYNGKPRKKILDRLGRKLNKPLKRKADEEKERKARVSKSKALQRRIIRGAEEAKKPYKSNPTPLPDVPRRDMTSIKVRVKSFDPDEYEANHCEA